jgi:serine protease AprX
MRRLTCSVAAVLVVFLVAQPATAASNTASQPPGGQSGPRRGELADRDDNKISDAFQPRLDAAEPGDRFQVIVTYAGPGNVATARREVGSFELSHEYTIVRGFAGTMTADQIRGLSHNPNVGRIEQNIKLQVHLDASRRDFGIDRARADYPAVTGAGAAICILDTGVDASHEQFDSKVITFRDWVGTSTTPYDDHGHGSHVADIAAGDGTGGVNAPTFRGVAPGSPLYIGKVLDSTGYGDDAEIVQAVEWCASQPDVRVISMSLGTVEASDGNDVLSQAVNNAVTSAGKVVVVAAGNSGDRPQTVGSPGAAVNAITVGAVAEWSAPVDAGAGRHSDGVYLAPFSSRGPTLSNVVKPDVVAPGVTVTAAKANTADTYITYDGTSMATPFVAGTAALALAANPALTPVGVRSLIEGTAQDRGPAGKDNDWGAGLLDGYAVVASASGAGSYTPTVFPNHSRINGSTPNNGQWSYSFTIGADALTVPIAATITLDGKAVCVFPWPSGCLGWEWDPDLEARLYAPNGTILSESTCAAGVECGMGRQETVHAMPTTTGTYTVRVYVCNTSCGGNGQGGTFAVDLSHGPVGTAPPPTNQPPVANAGSDQTVADADGNGTQSVTLNGSASSDPDGTITSYAWSEGGSPIATGATSTVGFAVGTHTVTLTVMDEDGATGTDQVVVIVRANQSPVAKAGPDQTVSDADGDGTQPVTLNGGSSSDPDGAITSYVWTESGSQIATGASPTVGFSVGTHTVTLTVTDNGGATATDQVVVTVTAPSPPSALMHVADLDGTRTARKGGAWTAIVTVTVHTSTHAPLAGVVVTGSWSDGTTASCTTGASGSCSMPTKNVRKVASITFTVSGLSRSGYAYESSANHDPDGDSSGTAITLTKP